MVIIASMDFHGIDLNLLVALQALLQARHVTRAAEQLGITQPAMSAALARLRKLFDDPLLVRGAKGLVLTPRADELLAQLAQIMSGVGQMMAPPTQFDPASSTRTFSLLGTDLIEFSLLPPLLQQLAQTAPSVRIWLKGPDFKQLEALLESAEVDLAIGYCPRAPDSLITRALRQEPFVCIARHGHPALRDSGLSLDIYTRLQHAQALPRGSTMYASAIDTTLAAMGLARPVRVWQPGFLAIAEVVAQTDLISTVPARVAAQAAAHLPITVYPVPFELPPTDIALYWHPRQQQDAGHQWLRQQVAHLLRAD